MVQNLYTAMCGSRGLAYINRMAYSYIGLPQYDRNALRTVFDL